MTRTTLLKTVPLAALICGLVWTVSFAQTGAGANKTKTNDTLPKKQKQVRDLDDALHELDRAEVDMLKGLRDVDAEKIRREVAEAMKTMDVDMAKMKEDMAKAMKEIDAQKINAEVQKGLAEMQKNLKEVDVEKIRAEVQASLARVDMEKMKTDLAKMRDIDAAAIKKQLEAIGPEIEKSMREAKASIEKAKEQLTAYKGLVDALEKDDLLKKGSAYTVEFKSGALTVNGKKLSAEETRKYSQFLNGKENFTLKKTDDDFNIED